MSLSTLPVEILQIIALDVGAPQIFGLIDQRCHSLDHVTYEFLLSSYRKEEALKPYVLQATSLYSDSDPAKERVKHIFLKVMSKVPPSLRGQPTRGYTNDQLNPKRLSYLLTFAGPAQHSALSMVRGAPPPYPRILEDLRNQTFA